MPAQFLRDPSARELECRHVALGAARNGPLADLVRLTGAQAAKHPGGHFGMGHGSSSAPIPGWWRTRSTPFRRTVGQTSGRERGRPPPMAGARTKGNRAPLASAPVVTARGSRRAVRSPPRPGWSPNHIALPMPWSIARFAYHRGPSSGHNTLDTYAYGLLTSPGQGRPGRQPDIDDQTGTTSWTYQVFGRSPPRPPARAPRSPRLRQATTNCPDSELLKPGQVRARSLTDRVPAGLTCVCYR